MNAEQYLVNRRLWC